MYYKADSILRFFDSATSWQILDIIKQLLGRNFGLDQIFLHYNEFSLASSNGPIIDYLIYSDCQL